MQKLNKADLNNMLANIQNSTNNIRFKKMKALTGEQISDINSNWQAHALKFGIPECYLKMSFKNFVPSTKTQSENVEKLKSLPFLGLPKFTIFMYGDPGTGKTHCAVSLMKEYLKHRMFMYFANVTRLKNDLIKNINSDKDVAWYGKSHRILCIDDLGAEKPTDFFLEQFYSIIDYRYMCSLPTIVTSNLKPSEVADVYHDRLASRLVSGMVLKFDGEDHRF